MGLFIPDHICYQAQLYLKLVYYFTEMIEPIFCQFSASKQDHFGVSMEFSSITDYFNVILRAIIHPNNNVFMKSSWDRQLAKVHVDNSLGLLLLSYKKISIRQKHYLFIFTLLSNNFACYGFDMKEHISTLAAEKTICLLKIRTAREKLSDRNYIIFYETILDNAARYPITSFEIWLFCL